MVGLMGEFRYIDHCLVVIYIPFGLCVLGNIHNLVMSRKQYQD